MKNELRIRLGGRQFLPSFLGGKVRSGTSSAKVIPTVQPNACHSKPLPLAATPAIDPSGHRSMHVTARADHSRPPLVSVSRRRSGHDPVSNAYPDAERTPKVSMMAGRPFTSASVSSSTVSSLTCAPSASMAAVEPASDDTAPTSTYFITQSTKRRLQATQVYFYTYYRHLMEYTHQRGERQQRYAQNDPCLSNEAKTETRLLRERRQRIALGHFQLQVKIGQGGYGQVFLARKQDTGELCALKRINKQQLNQSNEIQHILTERDILTASTSDWLVKLFYAFQDPQHLYLAMEYVPGGDMRTLLNHSGILRVKNARFYFAEIAAAVDALHQLGYIHRDLKPENFLIDATGHIKLTDFGLSNGALCPARINSMRGKLERWMRPSIVSPDAPDHPATIAATTVPAIRAYSMVGSPDYMAPEILRNSLGYDHRVDYWSLGCMLFEFLAGHPPFAASTAQQVWRRICNWERTLSRPRFSSPAASINFTDQAWELIQRLLTHATERIDTLMALKAQPFLSQTCWDELRQQEPPFIPKLRSGDDTSYFDDFSNPQDMLAYQDLAQQQQQQQKQPPPSSSSSSFSAPSTATQRPQHLVFAGFTYRHRPVDYLDLSSTITATATTTAASDESMIEQLLDTANAHQTNHLPSYQ